MLPQQPSVSAGPGYPSPFNRPLPAEPPSIPPTRPLPESLASGPINTPPIPSDQRNSVISATPEISAAIQYISESDCVGETANVRRRPKKKDQEQVLKEDWRKSDSTTPSYHTVRPHSGTSGSTSSSSGYTDLPSRLPTQSSTLYSNNITNFLLSVAPVNKPSSFRINLDDEVVRGAPWYTMALLEPVPRAPPPAPTASPTPTKAAEAEKEAHAITPWQNATRA